MEAPRQELFILNWEISDLTRKLQSFAAVYSKIDLTTVDCFSQLLETIDTFLTKTSLSRCMNSDATDEQIFNGYAFHHSINCKQCGRAVKTTRPKLLKHLVEHEADKQDSHTVKLNGDDLKLVKALEHIRLNDKDTSSQSDSTNTSSEVHKLDEDSINKGKPKKKDTDIKEHLITPTNDIKPKTTVVVNPFVDVITPEQGKLSRSSSTRTTVSMKSASKRDEPGTKETKVPKLSVKPQKHQKEPKRRAHVPNRTKEGEYLHVGSIPNAGAELTKKTKQFIIKSLPITSLMEQAADRKQIMDSQAHRSIVHSLEAIFQKYYPKTKVYLFGSRVTGLGSESSDLDIYLNLEDNYDGSLNYSKDRLKIFVQLSERALEITDQWSNLDPVTAARTPILRAWNKRHKIDCDISFTNGLSHSNTRLVQYLFAVQPVCYYVALYAKEWSQNFSMPGLNTYTLILLTVFYFQKHNLLPAIYNLQKDCEKPYLVSHWQANFERKSLDELGIPRVPEEETYSLIIDFFAFYGSRFCFDTRVVCPFLGWAPQKEDFDPYDCEIPAEMETLQKYYDKLDLVTAHPVNDLLSYTKPMVVQDPLELNHNVAKGLSATDVDRFRKFCAHTAALLNEISN